MEAKGVAFISRKKMIENQFGAEKWNNFIGKIALKKSYFKRNIMSTDLIPIEDFLYFTDEALKEFFNNDSKIYWMMGEKSAEYSLLEGPYKIFIKSKDIKSIVLNSFPMLWTTFYTKGRLESSMNNNIVDLKLVDLPISHDYFELVIMGYAKKALELVGAKNISYQAIKSIKNGDKEVHYRFEFQI
jgi:hypothetical protein